MTQTKKITADCTLLGTAGGREAAAAMMGLLPAAPHLLACWHAATSRAARHAKKEEHNACWAVWLRPARTERLNPLRFFVACLSSWGSIRGWDTCKFVL